MILRIKTCFYKEVFYCLVLLISLDSKKRDRNGDGNNLSFPEDKSKYLSHEDEALKLTIDNQSCNISLSTVYLLQMNKRLMFFLMTSRSQGIMVEVMNKCIRCAGEITSQRIPKCAIYIQDRKDSSSSIFENRIEGISENLWDLLYTNSILSFLFGVKTVEEIQKTCLLSIANKNIHFYLISTSANDFEISVSIYIYELISAISSESVIPFDYYIGTFNGILQEYGIKVISIAYAGSPNRGPTIMNTSYEGKFLSNASNESCYCSIHKRVSNYTGYCLHGQSHGYGKYSGRNSTVGYMKNGQPSFCSIYSYLDCRTVSLSRNSKTIGYEVINNQITYFGEFRNGKRNGYGLMLMSNGSVVAGSWTDNIADGLALDFSIIGTVYCGHLKGKDFLQYGEMFYRNQSFYKGCWNQSQYDQYGVLFLKRPHDSMIHCIIKYWDFGGEDQEVFNSFSNSTDREYLSKCIDDTNTNTKIPNSSSTNTFSDIQSKQKFSIKSIYKKLIKEMINKHSQR